MARKKAWTKKKRQRAARKGAVTRKKRAKIIEQAQQEHETGYALLIPFGTWIQDSIKLKQRVAQTVSLKKGAKSIFTAPDVVVGIVMAMQAGIVHFSHMSRLVPEVKLAESIGLPHFFGATTATDVLKMARPRPRKEMERILRQICFEQIKDDGEEIDIVIDTTGHASDSRQREQVAVGYCNGKKEPCLKSSRVVVNGQPVFVQVHPGNENPQAPFDKGLAIARWLCRRYPRRRVHLGMDTGFTSEPHLHRLHQLADRYENFRFTASLHVSHPQSQPFQIVQWAKAKAQKQWKQVNRRSRVLDSGFRKVYKDSRERSRVIVVESKNEKGPPPPPPKRKRKRKKKKKPAERYYLIATNYGKPERKGKQVFGRHHQRTVVEFSIKDEKQSYAIQHLPHVKFLVNEMHLLLVTLAQLLGIIYNQMLLPKPTVGSLVATVRSDLWRLPGRIIDATHLILNLVYHRLKWIRKVCLAVKRHFGICIDFAELNSS